MDIKKLPTTWNLTLLLKDSAPKEVTKQKNKLREKALEFAQKWKKRTDYLEDPKFLKQALDDYEVWEKNYGVLGNVGYYFELKYTQNQLDPKIKAQYNQLEELSNELINEVQFFTLNIAKIQKDKQEKFLKDPSLSPYKHFLDKLFLESKYLLSEPEEKILNLKSTPAHSNWTKLTSELLTKEEVETLDEKGKKKKTNYVELLSLMSSKNKKVRDEAAEGFNQILNKYLSIGEAEINSILANKKIDDNLRGLERPDSARHLSDDLDTKVVDTLVKSIYSRFDLSRRYYKLKARLMGLKKLKYHERNVEYGKLKKGYSYQDSVKLVSSSLTKLDPEFGQIYENFIEKGLFDVYPTKGKHGGAACYHNLLTQPTYIFLNHTDKLNDVLTIAHETGHGINNEFMRNEQNSLNFSSPLSTAEVASTFMEDFVLADILEKSDQEEALAILMTKLNDDISTIFRQIAAYRFEQNLHKTFREKGYLTYKEIGQIFTKNMSDYMGDGVEQSDGSENWWIYWNHFRSFFYVYTYASGLLISKSLQAKVKKDPEFIQKVKQFLSSGGSDSPLNIFLNLGLDIRKPDFWQEGLEEVDKLLDITEKLAKKLDKI